MTSADANPKRSPHPITRRAALGALTALPLARPGSLRAQFQSTPIKIGLLSDLDSTYRDLGGPGSKIAVEMACEDFGGSVLGRPLQVMQADDQNKADVASALVREWIDERGVDLLVDGAGSSAGLAIQEVARDRKRIFVMATPLSTAFVGKQCSPYGFQFVSNTYGTAKVVGSELVKAGGKSWFFITADYAFGHSLQHDLEGFVTEAGGRIPGSVSASLGTTEFSQYVLQAQASGAK
jgi:branched-chain amino acid transport system substrate-binding protein